MDGLTFLERIAKAKPQPVYVLHGEEAFLKRQVLAALRQRLFGGGDDLGTSIYPGDKTSFAAVQDELRTLPFLASCRLVVVDAADSFVTSHRAALERYLSEPAPHGLLVLDVKSWPANTRLAKLLPEAATINCKGPAAARLPDWCVRWVEAAHAKKLSTPAAKLLVDLVGGDMGLLDQELAKLAVYVGAAPNIEQADVDRLVGSSRTENAFKIFDAMAGGRADEALAILDSLLDQGEEPMRLLGAFSYQLRRLARAARLRDQGLPMDEALEQAGFPPFTRQSGAQQLRHLGPERTRHLYDWILEADLGLKGGSALPPRMVLEKLLIRLVQPVRSTAQPR